MTCLHGKGTWTNYPGLLHSTAVDRDRVMRVNLNEAH